jgi:hypothetical protein
MNSSAKQISPNGHRRETSRVANFPYSGSPDGLKTVPEPAASGPEYAVNDVD